MNITPNRFSVAAQLPQANRHSTSGLRFGTTQQQQEAKKPTLNEALKTEATRRSNANYLLRIAFISGITVGISNLVTNVHQYASIFADVLGFGAIGTSYVKGKKAKAQNHLYLTGIDYKKMYETLIEEGHKPEEVAQAIQNLQDQVKQQNNKKA